MLNPIHVTMEDVVMESEDFASAEIPERRVLLHPWLLEETITLISGFRGCGKSWLGFSILDAITKGTSFGPWRAINPVPCFYLDGEMHISDTQARLRYLGTEGRKEPLYIYSDALAALYGVQSSSLLRSDWRRNIEDLLISLKVKVLALDNIASLSPGIDENTKQSWDPVNQWLLRLRFKGIATILFHHVSKAGQQRGTSAREDNVDVSIQLSQPPDYTPQEGCRFNLLFTKRRTVADAQSDYLEPREFLLQANQGHAIWLTRTLAKKHQLDVAQMLAEGYKQTEIADALNIDKGQLSRIIREMRATDFGKKVNLNITKKSKKSAENSKESQQNEEKVDSD